MAVVLSILNFCDFIMSPQRTISLLTKNKTMQDSVLYRRMLLNGSNCQKQSELKSLILCWQAIVLGSDLQVCRFPPASVLTVSI